MCDLTKVAIFQCPTSQQGSCYAGSVNGSKFEAGQYALLPPTASIVDQNGQIIQITSQPISLNQCPASAAIVAVPAVPVSPTGVPVSPISAMGVPSWDNISNLVGGILSRI